MQTNPTTLIKVQLVVQQLIDIENVNSRSKSAEKGLYINKRYNGQITRNIIVSTLPTIGPDDGCHLAADNKLTQHISNSVIFKL